MKDKLCGIYCIENKINHKKYIGLSRNIKNRWYGHKSNLSKNQHPNPYLQYSWNKYGKDNFEFYIVELCEENLLSEKERYYIKLYETQSHQKGFNLTVGGENVSFGKPVISLKDEMMFDFVKEAADSVGVYSITMISWCKQRHNYMYLNEYNALSQEEKDYWKNFNWEEYDHQKLSKAHSSENLSQETIEKLRKATSGSKNPRAMKVYCPQLNEFFDCIKYASDKYDINRGSISQYLKGKLKSAGIHPITGEKLTWELIEN